MTPLRQAIQLPDVITYATRNQGRLHASVVARVQGAPDQVFLLTHPEGLDNPDDLALALRIGYESLEGPGTAMEVPDYAQTLAERVEAIRTRLLGPVPNAGVRADLEREADHLGRALGAALARTYLEQRRGGS